MTILFSAPCMASSGPNPYGQPQAPASVLSNSKSNNIYHNNNTNNNDNNQQISATNIHAKTTSAPLASGQQMPHDGGDKPLVHPANFSLLANNYDGYIAGMSSDSELTAGGPTSSRHHHHYHHRPYSSQSRVYHAHPVPKTSSGASSRMSHYSDSAAAAAAPTGPPTAQSSSSSSSAVAGSNSFAIHQHQKKQQPPISNQAVSMTSPANVISSNHQSSMAPSGSSASSSTYLAGGVAGDSPLSPVMHQQQQQQVMARLAKSGAGRQLPQRPFKQSMSIDHQSIGAHQYQQMGDGSPVHHGSLSSHRNLGLGDDSAPMGGYQAQSYLNQQHFGAGTGQQYGPAGVAMSPRSLRLEMAMMEKQTANMNIYDAANDNPTARLPPTASGRPSSSSSSSTSRQLPSLGTSQAQGLLGSMSLDQQHHQVDPFHQQSPQHHQQHHHQQHQHHQEPYASHHQQVGSASTEWLPPVGSTGPAGQHNSLARPSGHFKQTLSIDHYAGLHHQPHQHHQQYSPARNQHFVGEHYGHQSGPYSATPLIGNYDSSAGGGADQASYYSGNQESQSTLPHETYYQAQHKKQIVEPGQHQQQQQITSTSLDYPNVIRAPSAPTGRPPLVALQARQINRPTLHHQVSDSSSNSNQSGSLKSSNLEDGLPDKQTAAASGEHQKSISSSSSAAAAAAQYGLQQQHQSPQHKATAGRAQSGGQHRPDMLRRGYTSLTMGTTYGATDLGDSQTALSESGDMSSSGGLASGSHAHIGLLAGKRVSTVI